MALPVRDHMASEALGLWEPKRSLTLEAARQHTRRIQLLRKVLILMAAGLVVMLGLQFMGGATTTFDNPNPEESVKMVNPRYSGRTADGLPFYLTADTATRTQERGNDVMLVKPVLEFIRADGAASSFVLAQGGTYNDVTKILNLEESVNLETDDGYVCKTTHARIFAREKRIEGEKPINCLGTFGAVNGQAYEINENYTEFVFKGGMDAEIRQDPAQIDSAVIDTPEDGTAETTNLASAPVATTEVEAQGSFAFAGDGPIFVKADRGIYKGGTTQLFDAVDVKQGAATINADVITILRREATSDADGSLRLGEVNKIIAKQDFRYQNSDTDVRGNQGVYERDKNLITVTGNVSVMQPGGNMAKTDRLTYNTVTETARFSGNCQGRDCGTDGRTRVTIGGNN
jgi:lipopolysaccharide transport protein LptA